MRIGAEKYDISSVRKNASGRKSKSKRTELVKERRRRLASTKTTSKIACVEYKNKKMA